MSPSAARNARAKSITASLIAATSDAAAWPQLAPRYPDEARILEDLIPVKAAGFRGIVVTGIIGKLLDTQYSPLGAFYDCSPRSLFEQGIYYALREAGIPSGLSDPLNVAKNIQKIDLDWASGKRPETAAKAAVHYLTLLEQAWADSGRRDDLINLFFARLNRYAGDVRSKNKAVRSFEGVIPAQVARKLADFVVECPEAGAIPQFVVGGLIEIMRASDARYASVEGWKESVFGTNTTGKKPADVWEVLADGQLGNLYEITVKKIDEKRLDDCVSSLTETGVEASLVTFLCRLPEDVTSLESVLRGLNHGGIAFQFLDIRHFIQNGYCLLQKAQQAQLISQLQEFVFRVERAEKTKEYWASNFG